MNILLFVCATGLFCIMYMLATDNDKESAKYLVVNTSELITIFMLLALNTMFAENTNGDTVLKTLSVLIFTILLFNSYCDYKIQNIYRIYSLLFLFVSGIYFMYWLIKSNIAVGSIIATAIGTIIVIFILSSGAIKQLSTMGLGDGFALIGTSLYILTLHTEELFPVELILYHFIFSTALLVIFHIKSFSWKEKKFKKQIAFLPYIYISLYLIILFYKNQLYSYLIF